MINLQNIMFICVNYNNSRYTEKFIKSLLQQNNINPRFKISMLVVDNSTDLSEIQLLKNLCELNSEFVKLIIAEENLGYFGGLNYGLSQINHLDYDFIIIGNNDLEFKDDFCCNLLDKKINLDVLALVPEVITSDGVQQNPHVLKPISWVKRFEYDIFYLHWYVAEFLFFIKYNIFKQTRKHPLIKYSPQPIHMGIGAIYILTKNFFKFYSQLDFPLFLYGEEAFFSHQIHKVNGVIMFEPDLVVYHAESAATSKLAKRKVYEYSKKGYPLYRKYL